MIDERAVVHEGAQVDPTAEIGPYAVIGPNVKIGARTVISPHAVIDGWTTIGEECRIFSFASVGSVPQDLKYAGEKTFVEVGDRTQIRENVTINLGTEGGGGLTKVGSDCLLMAYSHVAHDCIVGDRVILANAATLAGHIIVEDWVIVGGLTAIHQFVRIGQHAFLGGCSAVVKDIPPFVTASGNRAKLFGLNLEGLKRRGFSRETLSGLRKSYKTIFKTEKAHAEAMDEARELDEYKDEAVKAFVDFVDNSERGVTR